MIATKLVGLVVASTLLGGCAAFAEIQANQGMSGGRRARAAHPAGKATSPTAPPKTPEQDPDPRLTMALTRLKMNLAVRKLPSLKADDINELAKVQEAFEAADLGMIMATDQVKYFNGGAVRVVPDGAQAIDRGHTVGLLFSEGNASLMDGHEELPYPTGMPAVAWDATVVGALLTIRFVTADGFQLSVPYSLSENPPERMRNYVKPYDPAADWPPTVDYAMYLRASSAVALAKMGAIPKEIGEALTKVEEQANRCAASTWKPFAAQLDALDEADLLYETRQNRKDAVRERGSIAVDRACRGLAKGMAAPMRKAVEARRAEQAKLYEAVRVALRRSFERRRSPDRVPSAPAGAP